MKIKKRLLQIQVIVLTFIVSVCSQTNAQSVDNEMLTTFKSSGYAPVNGLKIYYEIHGDGDPVVMLHGAYMTVNGWGELLPKLAENRKVIALELQGHGRTADSDRPYSYSALASDVAGVLEYLEVDNADILGYSFGGTVGIQFAINYPQLVRKSVIISTVYKYDGWLPKVREALASFQPDFFDNTPMKTEYESLAPDPSHWYAFVDKFMKFDTECFDLGEENIRSIQSPALLIMGDNDGVDITHKTEFYKLLGGDVFGDMESLPKSQLAIFPGTTHVGIISQTEKMAATINSFLNSNN